MSRLLKVLVCVVLVSGLMICGCSKKDKGGGGEPNQVAALY